jgi:hypothetical protein
MEDREVTIDSARVMEAIAAVSDPRSSFYPRDAPREPAANELMGRRMESGVLAVLGQLEATGTGTGSGGSGGLASRPRRSSASWNAPGAAARRAGSHNAITAHSERSL